MKKIVKKIYCIIKLLIINIFTNNNINIFCNIGKKTKFNGHNYISNNVSLLNSSVGNATYIRKDSSLNNTLIGKYCSIAENVKVVLGNHPTKDLVSTHPAFFSKRKQAGFTYVNEQKYDEIKILDSGYSVEIGNDVWIGANVTIMEGVKIADGSIIGCGAVVTKNTEPYSINVGVPSKKIKSRFNDEQINYLYNLKWWDKPEKWIKDNSKLFLDVKELMKNERRK